MESSRLNGEILSGKIQDHPLSELLQKFQASKATGTLTLRHNGREKSIYIKNGDIVFAASNVEEDRLGATLVKAGKLTPQQVQDVLRLQGASNKKFGAVIVEFGYVKPRELFEGLKFQVKEIIFSLFRWDEGLYRFTPGALPDDAIVLVLDPIQLISEIITRLKEDSSPG